ncbi:MAG: tRNA (adenosine(37)-N6)-threonylcarbamoyltransferase complex dimerization subunit type 1 TsaB [Dehalococcoidia bacterium]
MELAIDTSSDTAGIALSRQGEILASVTWRTAQNHTVELLPNLVCLLQRIGVELDSAEAIIVAKGPGSFNGLRVGVSTAKGLASALNIRFLGVSTFEAEAYPFAFTGLAIRPIHRAGREEIATALYRQEDADWRCLEAENLTTVTAVCRRIRQKTILCGEIPSDIMSEIRHNVGGRVIVSQDGSQSRAASLAIVGWRRLSRGEQDDPANLQPLYLRPPHITTARARTPQIVTLRKAKEPSNASPQSGS